MPFTEQSQRLLSNTCCASLNSPISPRGNGGGGEEGQFSISSAPRDQALVYSGTLFLASECVRNVIKNSNIRKE